MDEPDTPEQLRARALRHLVRREHSRAELARKLAPHAVSAVAVEQVLDLLLSKRQQSDQRYAEDRSRVLSRKRARRRMRSATVTCRGGQAPFDRVQHFGHFDVEQAHAGKPALSQVVTLAHRCA